MNLYDQCRVIKYNQGQIEQVDDVVIADYPLTIILNGQELTTLVCSPGAWPELVVGFLRSSGLINNRQQLLHMNLDQESGYCQVEIPSYSQEIDNSGKRFYNPETNSSLYFIRDASQLKPVLTSAKFTVPELLDLSQQLDEQSRTFQITGAAHSVGMGDKDQLLFRYEDIGRHNALDKVLGYALLNDISSVDKCVILSGRVAAEMLLKAAHAEIPLVLSRAAPTALALRIARELGITVVGFARGDRLNIYCHEWRIAI